MANNFLKIKNGATLRQQGTVPTNPVNGDLYYDSNQNSFVIYNNGVWMNLTSRVDIAGATNLTSATLTSTVSQNTLIRITGTTTTNLCGLAASSGGKQVVIYNDTTESLSLKYQDSTEPVPANRLTNSTSTDVVLKTGQTAVLIYDDVADIWIVASSPGSGGIEAPGPTVQTFLSGSGTYTTPPNVSFISVRMVGGGGGGGGGGSSNSNGGTGGNTTFGGILSANGGGGGQASNNGFQGGGPGGYSITPPAIGFGVDGGFGDGGSGSENASAPGVGGNSALGGGGGGGGGNTGATSYSGSPNTGGGGGGGGVNGNVSGGTGNAGGGGGAGGYVDAIIVTPAPTYSYSVGGGGGAGSGAGAGGQNGGSGGSGIIVVTEYYYNGLGALAGNGGAYTPTVTTLTGSGTFTTPVNASYINIKMVGGGAGGCGANNAAIVAGGSGGTTTFGGILTCGGGTGGSGSGAPGGGTSYVATAGLTIISAINGGTSNGGGLIGSGEANSYTPGGNGASTPLGEGGGGGGPAGSQPGNNATGYGAGGGGAGGVAGGGFSGSGGASGGYIEAIIVNPATSYTYSVGGGGAGGSSTSSGNSGTAGVIIITTYYNNGAVGTATTVTGRVASGNGGVPTGTLLPFAGSTAPTGYLLCNGASYSTASYPALFATIGYTYGGSGANFNVPNTQGVFLRGAGSQTISGINYSTTSGAQQEDTMQGHIHNLTPSAYGALNGDPTYSGPNTQGSGSDTTSGPVSDGTNGTPRISPETRPANIGVNYIIAAI